MSNKEISGRRELRGVADRYYYCWIYIREGDGGSKNSGTGI